jgi:endonuclease/exonuclease/phosphatase (EEP) superfamily protein YafD
MATFEQLVQFVIATLLILGGAAYLGRLHKYFELLSHFKVQYLIASVGCLLICLILRNWPYAAGALLGVAINLSSIASLYKARISTTNQIGESRRLKLLLANVYRLNSEHEKFLACIQRHRPDVVIVQEEDDVWANALQVLSREYPFSVVLSRDYGSGIALYSRFLFERLPVALSEGEARPGILVRLNVEGVRVSLLSIHPRAPIRRGHFERRNKMLTAAAACLQNLPEPKICIGDLNISLWSPFYRDFAEQTKLVNVREGIGLLPSWPTFMYFEWLMIPIDHCLVSDDIRVIMAQLGEPIGSDHLPLIIELEIKRPSEATAQK